LAKVSKNYTAKDSVVDLVNEDYNILPVLSRFSLPLGFGNGSVGDLCREANIDVNVFLLVVNFLLSGEIDESLLGAVSPLDVVKFLHNSHDYYLSYKFPHIRANLLNALDDSHQDINPIIVKFFDDYIDLVRHHFEYEEKVVFPYVKTLQEGQHSKYTIEVFRRQHDDDVEEKLSELKNIILRYYTTAMPYKMYDVLVDIYNCEEDLASHALIENKMLVPIISKIERQ
jgi:regulator of cell morphogenesis and NO signaling